MASKPAAAPSAASPSNRPASHSRSSRQRRAATAVALGLAGLVGLTACQAPCPCQGVEPLPNAHAHNDYAHSRPLLDALDHGFLSVEADIHLVDGELLVAHDREDVHPDRTLRRLYLDPLRARIQACGGRVYPDTDHQLLLLIDIKSDGDPTYAVLHRQLAEYAGLLTTVKAGRVHPGPIQVVISGKRPVATIRAQQTRYAAYDGRPEDLDSDAPAHLIPLISANASKTFAWRGAGPVPPDDLRKLRRFVRQAHARNRKLRFWATPDRPLVWQLLADAGVDLINVDDLAGLRQFLLGRHDAPPVAGN